MTSSWRNLVWGWKKITVSLGVETAEKMPHEKSPSLRFPEKKEVRAMRHRSVCICQVLPYITKTCYLFIYYCHHHYNYYYRLNAKSRISVNKCHQIGVCVLLKILMVQCSTCYWRLAAMLTWNFLVLVKISSALMSVCN